MPYGKEYPSFPEFSLHLIEAFARSFIHRFDCYPIQLEDGAYTTVYRPLTSDLLQAHIRGEKTLGTYALDQESNVHWICFDADKPDQWQELLQMASDLAKQDITAYIEPSRRGGHLWLFTLELTGFTTRKFAKQLLLEHDITGIEIYPKQDKLTTGVGSFVRLPLGIHRKSGKRYHFINQFGEPLAPTIRQQLALLASPILVPQGYIDRILSATDSSPPPPHKIFAKLRPSSGETLSERIKNSISVFDFVSRYVELDTLGKGFCPFHNDQHKSFGVHLDRNFWHCYAECGNPPSLPNGGTVIDFWIRMRHKQGQDYSFASTIKDLARILFG